MRNVLAHAGKQGRRVVAAFIGTAFAQDDAEAAGSRRRQVADQLRPGVKKLAELMDEAESDVLAYMSFPPAHRPKLHSTNPIERLNGEIKRRTEVVGTRLRHSLAEFLGFGAAPSGFPSRRKKSASRVPPGTRTSLVVWRYRQRSKRGGRDAAL